MKNRSFLLAANASLILTIVFYFLGTTSQSAAMKLPLATVDDLRVTVLSDMTVGGRWMHAEWGFSALVEVKTDGAWKKILFDTGADPSTVMTNVDRLARLHGMKDANGNPFTICDVDTAVLSHNHLDHTMGLVEIRRRCGSGHALSTVYVGGPEIFWSRPRGKQEKNVMLPGNGASELLDIPAEYDAQGVKKLFESTGGKFVMPASNGPVGLPGFTGVWVTGKIPRVYDEKTYPGVPNVIDPSTGKPMLDIIPEEQALVINTAKGLVVITGCAHAGLVNTLSYAQNMLGETVPIYAVLGGFHSLQMKIGNTSIPGTLAWTADQLAKFGVSHILGAHCTGMEALAYLRKAIGAEPNRVMSSTVATLFDLKVGIVPAEGGLNHSPDP